MKKVIETYSFNPVLKQVDLSAISNFKIENLLAIINATSKATIYAVGQSGLGYTTVSSGVVTLDTDTSLQLSSDKLLILYEDSGAIQKTQDDSLNSLVTEIKAMNELMQVMILNLVNNQPQMDIAKRLSVVVASLPTLATVTNVASISNINSFSGGNTAQLPFQLGMGTTHIYDKITTS